MREGRDVRGPVRGGEKEGKVKIKGLGFFFFEVLDGYCEENNGYCEIIFY